MIKRVKIDGKDYPFVMSMATVENYLYTRNVPLTDVGELFTNLSTKDVPDLILEGFKVGAMLENTECNLTVNDLLKANAKGELSLMNMVEDLGAAAEEGEQEAGK